MFFSGNQDTEKGIILSLVVTATVVPIVVLVGITLALGIALVYLIISKKRSTRTRSLTNDRYKNLAFCTINSCTHGSDYFLNIIGLGLEQTCTWLKGNQLLLTATSK